MEPAKVFGRNAAEMRGAASSEGSAYVFTLVSRDNAPEQPAAGGTARCRSREGADQHGVQDRGGAV